MDGPGGPWEGRPGRWEWNMLADRIGAIFRGMGMARPQAAYGAGLQPMAGAT